LTIKRQPRTPGAVNGSNRIVLRCPRSADINALNCLDDPLLTFLRLVRIERISEAGP
jgi:hypothetical protein